jgi:predicted AAA+ superfamily ATPase
MKNSLETALKLSRVVVLSGPRQSGKTTLTRQIANDNMVFLNFDDATLVKAAKLDPKGFVQGYGEKTVVIDEVQKVPEVLPAIKQVVDKNNRAGQYLLTGSANLFSLPTVTESLAGRAANIRLRTLVQKEIARNDDNFFVKLRDKKLEKRAESYDKSKILGLAVAGGYPEILRLPEGYRQKWHSDYLGALFDHDLKDITNIQKRDVVEEIAEVLAGWSGKYMDFEAIGGKLAIARQTLESYVNSLVAMYLFDRVKPWVKTDYDRVGKKSKIYATDTGLMCSLLGWRAEELKYDPDRAGKLIETYVYSQLAVQADVLVGYDIYHYRDRDRHEIDLVVEDEKGGIIGIEVKSGSKTGREDAKNLYWFRDNIAKDRQFTGIVLYTGETTFELDNNFWAVPIGAIC